MIQEIAAASIIAVAVAAAIYRVAKLFRHGSRSRSRCGSCHGCPFRESCLHKD
ncbi:MAG: FeoB-associated Cys-rich membrane protein [Tannerellaceae bacterium]|nr:FeoB-associated Cys-rich membrane protein [Tannerellaceae bacterium]